jgi:hypothetical protein
MTPASRDQHLANRGGILVSTLRPCRQASMLFTNTLAAHLSKIKMFGIQTKKRRMLKIKMFRIQTKSGLMKHY